MEKTKEFYSKHCCPIGKTRPTLEQMEEYIKQGKETVPVNISNLEMKDELSKIIFNNAYFKFSVKDIDNGHNISIGPTKHKILGKLFESITIVLDSYDEDKIKKAFDENMFIDVKNLNQDDIRKVMICFLNYRFGKDELPLYLINEFYHDPRIVNASIESRKFAFDEAHKIMKNSQYKKKKRDFRKLEFKHNNQKFR
ncbi:hypothetical protein L5F43_09830 [Aliarcobacter butzleri]|uniref:hypothetical protein n=1 Tax=Aliarcobacter butzleri TaxID=28197 RepID=UPI001EDB2135|nr:hypothetical protein [Aliarcobacter butzleri]MCG3688487.1 hypothetical protein [Aliarcobacter butzleri]MCG3706776.1 hypothetical protein [Aliarcobacter butzleri]MCT7557324.1 hypothetical protein [Aliarcobacter butzleri]MCT7557412.1 hypothetical protein [Aliarcobacter butzleri]MCT7592439.1 hypothetical protein [Aliarcobacter butzleri]